LRNVDEWSRATDADLRAEFARAWLADGSGETMEQEDAAEAALAGELF
jgi:hypothetical protein